jgi:hypothetical protein
MFRFMLAETCGDNPGFDGMAQKDQGDVLNVRGDTLDDSGQFLDRIGMRNSQKQFDRSTPVLEPPILRYLWLPFPD